MRFSITQRVGFIDERKDEFPAVAFADPAQVIRALDLIIDFFGGQSTNGLGPSLLPRRTQDRDKDDNYFYVDWRTEEKFYKELEELQENDDEDVEDVENAEDLQTMEDHDFWNVEDKAEEDIKEQIQVGIHENECEGDKTEDEEEDKDETVNAPQDFPGEAGWEILGVEDGENSSAGNLKREPANGQQRSPVVKAKAQLK
ncbi:hypothetical protein BKA70DRAFT_1480580 [Coprinopsis sp. MPI-PUGE-AT-0042]|nr:hypothetical protein BKA70DRAFT_1480580 [Coprinopsis sp. MPI-PUGE-AT-0042]